MTGAPERSGFGTELIDRLLAMRGGTLERRWSPDGLEATLALPLHPATG